MLEQIRNRTQTTFAKVILVIIIIPFALFGIDSYLSSVGSNVSIASVNDEPITSQEVTKNRKTIYGSNNEVKMKIQILKYLKGLSLKKQFWIN